MPISNEKKLQVMNNMGSYAALWAGFMRSLDNIYGIDHEAPIEWRLPNGMIMTEDGLYKVPLTMESDGKLVTVTFFWPDSNPEWLECPVADIDIPL